MKSWNLLSFVHIKNRSGIWTGSGLSVPNPDSWWHKFWFLQHLAKNEKILDERILQNRVVSLLYSSLYLSTIHSSKDAFIEVQWKMRDSESWGWNFKQFLRNKLRFTWGWAEVLSMAYVVQILNWLPDLSSSLCPYYVYHRGARPKVSLRWQDLRLITRRLGTVRRKTQNP